MDGIEMRSGTYVDQWIGNLRSQERCEWCGEDGKPMKKSRLSKARLCASCKRTEKHLSSTKQRVEASLSAANKHEAFLLTFALQHAEEMKKRCIADGGKVRKIIDAEDFTPLDLELEFRAVSHAITRDRKLHFGIATALGWTFAPKQRQVLAYLLWKSFHADGKRKRWKRASGMQLRQLSGNSERRL